MVVHVGKSGKDAGWWVVRDAIASGDEFANYGKSFYSERWRVLHGPYSGRLPQEFADQLKQDAHIGINYVIYSYSTPIAWRLVNGEWIIPAVTYSPTTSYHQSKTRVAIDQL